MAAPQTLAQKLIARAAGRATVTPGEIVTCAVDLAMFHDSSGPRRLKPMLDELGAQIWDKRKVVLVLDHYVPERDDESRRIVKIARDWAAEQQLPHVVDSQGICHIVVPAARPDPARHVLRRRRFALAHRRRVRRLHVRHRRHRDARRGGHRRDLAARCRRRSRCTGTARLAAGVSAKDMMLAMLGRFGMNGGRYQAVEYTRRRGARAVDGRAHDAGQHERRTRRAGRPDRAGCRHARLAGRTRRRRLGHRHRALAQRRRQRRRDTTSSTPTRSRRRSRCRTARPTCRR